MDNPVVWLLLAVAAWMLYMMTFRTSDFLRLMKEDEERKQRQADRLGKAAKGAVSLFRWLRKK